MWSDAALITAITRYRPIFLVTVFGDTSQPAQAAHTKNRKKMQNQHTLIAAWAFLFLIVAILSLHPALSLGSRLGIDKLGHFSAYSLLAALPAFAVARPRRLASIVTILLFAGFAFEVIQTFIPHRVPAFADLAANGAGCCFGTGAGRLARRWRKTALTS